jgi:hypothetical protein
MLPLAWVILEINNNNVFRNWGLYNMLFSYTFSLGVINKIIISLLLIKIIDSLLRVIGNGSTSL